jgi:phosphohistidine phosphatase SixA
VRRARLVLPCVLLLAAAAARAAAQGATTVILVRHAEKVDANPLDRDAPLSPAGRRRARDLAAALQGRRVDAILVTQLKRTRETARPLAARRGITPEETHLGRDSDSAAAEVVSLIRARHRGQTVVVVGHSTTIPRIIALLGGPTLRPLCENAHRHLYTLVVPRAGPVRLTHTHFGAPDPPSDLECVDGHRPSRPTRRP